MMKTSDAWITLNFNLVKLYIYIYVERSLKFS